MNIFSFTDEGLLLGVFAAFGGCSIRYGEYYKRGKLNLKFYFVDALTAIFLGAFVYVYLVHDLEISVLHASLFNIIIGNLGSRIITLACNLFKSNFKNSLNNLLK